MDPEPTPQHPVRPATVLLVEDEPRIRRQAARALQNAGFGVDTAVNGDAALREAGQKKFSLVLLDLTLPPPDGWSTLRHLRRHQPELRVLITSENDFSSQARALGAVGLLRKPFDDSALIAAVETSLAARLNGTAA